MLGKNIKIYAGTSGTTPVIAMAKSAVIHSKCDLIEKASATNATSKEFVAGREEWDVSLNHLVSSEAPVDGLLKVRNTYTLRVIISNNGSNTTVLQGTAICEDATITGTTGNLGTGSIKFRGSGPLLPPPSGT